MGTRQGGGYMARGWDNFPFLHVFSPSAVSVPGDADLLCDLVSCTRQGAGLRGEADNDHQTLV